MEDITNADDQLLVEFTGWYTDAQFKHKYMPTRINSDITLYAGYIAHSVKVTFVSTNAMTDSGYVYLTSIYPKYYDGNVDFTSSELQEAILELNNFDITFSFKCNTISVTGLDGVAQNYYVYSNDASTVNDFAIKFSY